jgi:hypothetical protein
MQIIYTDYTHIPHIHIMRTYNTCIHSHTQTYFFSLQVMAQIYRHTRQTHTCAAVGTDSDLAKFCSCVVKCEKCVGSNGGCGKHTSALGQDGNYDNLFGTCSGPCQAPYKAPSSTSPSPTSAFYTCPAPPTNVLSKYTGTCTPSCVKCLAEAMESNCNFDTSENNACPKVDKAVFSQAECLTWGTFTASRAGLTFRYVVACWYVLFVCI